MLSRRQRYDYRDIDRRELALIVKGHAVWLRFKRERAKNGPTVVQDALLQQCEEIWAEKRALRAKLKVERAEAFKKWQRP
jgi:mannitol-1-phosphate/altronate dehydrogenase